MHSVKLLSNATSCICHNVRVHSKKHITANVRGASASVIREETEQQYGSGLTMKALLKGAKQACFCLHMAITPVHH